MKQRYEFTQDEVQDALEAKLEAEEAISSDGENVTLMWRFHPVTGDCIGAELVWGES